MAGGGAGAGAGAGLSSYLQGVLATFNNAKTEYQRYKEESSQLREMNGRLRLEIQEARELEQSHRYHLSASREIITDLQQSVANLVPLKRDIKKLTAELETRDKTITIMKEERQKLQKIHDAELQDLRASLEQQMDLIAYQSDAKIQNIEKETDTRVAQSTCLIAELNDKINELEIEHKEKMNMVVLEYEERLQRSASQLTQLRDQHAGLVARTDANMEVYRRRLEEVEQKLKQSEFKNLLTSSAIPHCNIPYEVQRTNQTCSDAIDLERDPPKPKPVSNCQMRQPNRAPNPLQVVYYENKPEKKTFNIVKKRKLYTEKKFI